MPKVRKSLRVPFSPQQMYDLVNNVADYPQFLPWCLSSIVHHADTRTLNATLSLGSGPLQQEITTLNTMIPASKIVMEYKAGPFKSCKGSWEFNPVESGCEIIFAMQYEYSNMLHSMAIEPIFNPIANKLIDAFYNRAKELYGK